MVGRSLYNLESGPVVSGGKECRQTLFCVQHVKSIFTSNVVVFVVTSMVVVSFLSMFVSIWVYRLNITELPDSVRRSAP